MLRDFVERVCTGYSALMRTHATSCRSRLNAVLADVQLRGEYVRGYFILVGEDGYSLHIAEATNGEERAIERGDRLSPQNDGDDDIIEVVVTPFNPPIRAP